jgi:uncharacterized membrane protein (UPF0127 family)
MSGNGKRKGRAGSRPPLKRQTQAGRYLLTKAHMVRITALIVAVLAVSLWLFTYEKGNLFTRLTPNSADQQGEVSFRKEGELVFLNHETNQILKKIDIEIVRDQMRRMRGLMYRRSLPDSSGMLFVYERPEPRTFWMKNTYIPLDICFVDENRKIITIHRNTRPQSEKHLSSTGKAQYVVEVSAGFCDRYGIREGDSIQF